MKIYESLRLISYDHLDLRDNVFIIQFFDKMCDLFFHCIRWTLHGVQGKEISHNKNTRYNIFQNIHHKENMDSNIKKMRLED